MNKLLPNWEAARILKTLLLGEMVTFIMKSFAIIALLGLTQAISCAPQSCQAFDGCSAGQGTGYSGKQASLPQGGGIGTLTSQLAGASTQIGAQKIVVPDKKTVTDQAKVSKTTSQTKKQDQGCAVAKRTFDVAGGIKITQKSEATGKAESSATHCGENAS